MVAFRRRLVGSHRHTDRAELVDQLTELLWSGFDGIGLGEEPATHKKEQKMPTGLDVDADVNTHFTWNYEQSRTP